MNETTRLVPFCSVAFTDVIQLFFIVFGLVRPLFNLKCAFHTRRRVKVVELEFLKSKEKTLKLSKTQILN